jgi:hypothetical protein
MFNKSDASVFFNDKGPDVLLSPPLKLASGIGCEGVVKRIPAILNPLLDNKSYVSIIYMKICKVNNCKRIHIAHGYCSLHLYRFKRYGNPLGGSSFREMIHPNTCIAEGCHNKYIAKGFCFKHYQRIRLTGELYKLKRNEQGTGHINDKGYKEYRINGKIVYEHRDIMEKHLKRKLLPFPKEIVHHIDGNKLNNHISNLCIMSASKHASMHMKKIRNQ